MSPPMLPVASSNACVFVIDQVPPGKEAINRVTESGQILDRPLIVTPAGEVLTVMIFIVVALPHELVTMYLIVTVSIDIPVTTPPVETVAEPLLLLHTPLVTEQVSVIVTPVHTFVG